MTLEEFKSLIIESEIKDVISFITNNKDSIKVIFINISGTIESKNIITQMLQHLNKISISVKETEEIQFLFKEIAFYCKKINNTVLVTTCMNGLTDSILKNRLLAWHQYKSYNKTYSHIGRFEAYLQKLSEAVLDDTEEYIDDILLDLHTYKTQYAEFVDFQNLFIKGELLDKYFILREYQDRKHTFEYKIELHEKVDKIFTPSVFTDKLFNEKFLNYIKFHPETKWHTILLGYNTDTIRSEIIKYGQANFDSSYNNLKSNDIVKLYCYFNMRKHYYTSLYLYERCLWLKDLVSTGGCIKFIDIGCGPATSGIAFTDFLFGNNSDSVPFDYIGVDFYQSMLDSAEDLMSNGVYSCFSNQQYIKSLKLIDKSDLSDAKAIIINVCYLFASPNLDVNDLANDVNELLDDYNEKPRFLLFQNTTDAIKNVKYNIFKTKLLSHIILLSDVRTVNYNNQKNSTYTPKTETVYFEVLKF
jgi:hypothetical protein